MDVTLMDTFDVAAQLVDGYAVYPKAHRSGATLLERALAEGTEDYLSFETRPAKPEVSYRLALGDGVSGLRLVADTLEMIDDYGAPRLRVAPPFIVGADGVRTEATLALEGCVADQDTSVPWGRPVTAPGASVCTVRVRWPDESVVYPAVLDPRWTTTHAMTTPRQGHTATLLAELSPEDQALIKKLSKEMQQEQRVLWYAAENAAIEKMKAAGTEIITDIDKKTFQDAVKPVWDKYGAKYAAMVKRIEAVN